MSKREEFFERVRSERVLAIVRSEGDLASTVEALWDGGIKLVEIALTSGDFTAAQALPGRSEFRQNAGASTAFSLIN